MNEDERFHYITTVDNTIILGSVRLWAGTYLILSSNGFHLLHSSTNVQGGSVSMDLSCALSTVVSPASTTLLTLRLCRTIISTSVILITLGVERDSQLGVTDNLLLLLLVVVPVAKQIVGLEEIGRIFVPERKARSNS